MGKRGPKAADNLPRSHSEVVAERPPPTPSPTAGLPGSAAWGLTIVWALQDQVPCRLGPAILSTGYGDTAWAKMWGGDSQMTTTTVTVHIHSGSPDPTMIQLRCAPPPPEPHLHPVPARTPPPRAGLLGGPVRQDGPVAGLQSHRYHGYPRCSTSDH